MKDKKSILLYGSGGHEAQMKRLLKLLCNDALALEEFVAIIENDANAIEGVSETFFVSPLRDKFTPYKSIKNSLYSVFECIYSFHKLCRKYDVRVLISTGPGVAIFPMLLGRLLGKEIIYIETWSRFYNKSLAGKVMYRLANKFYVQNRELLILYPKAIYSGKL
tara:strand:- start:5319 stop:5810 length:492 start_codon:yes stop_codon:yes gene_type:complete